MDVGIRYIITIEVVLQYWVYRGSAVEVLGIGSAVIRLRPCHDCV